MRTLRRWLVVERIADPSMKVDRGRSIPSRWNPLTIQPNLVANAATLPFVGDGGIAEVVETVHRPHS